LRFGAIRAEELLVEIASEEVGTGDRHNRGRHQGADGDAGKGDAHEPGIKRLKEERRYRVIRTVAGKTSSMRRVLIDAGGDCHVAEQRDEPEHEGISRKQRRVAPDHTAVRRAQDPGHGMRIEEQRQRRAEGQGEIGAVGPRLDPVGCGKSSFCSGTLAKIAP
jgi:hypothetical protein